MMLNMILSEKFELTLHETTIKMADLDSMYGQRGGNLTQLS